MIEDGNARYGAIIKAASIQPDWYVDEFRQCLNRDDVGIAVSRLLGFDRLSAQMLQRVNSRVPALIGAGRLIENGSGLAVANGTYRRE